MQPRLINIYDLELYSYCPKLYKFYIDNQYKPEQFQDPIEIAMSKTLTWMFTSVLRTGKQPNYMRLDTTWARWCPNNLEEDKKTSTWINLRKFLKHNLPNYVPAYVGYPIRLKTGTGIIRTQCPVIAENSNETVALFFRHSKHIHFINDYQIRLCIAALSKKLNINRVTIYNTSPHLSSPYKYNLYTSDIDNKGFVSMIKGLTRSVCDGPYHPVFRCTRKKCRFYKDCVI